MQALRKNKESKINPMVWAWEGAEGGRNEKFEFGVSFKSLLDIQAEILTMEFHLHIRSHRKEGHRTQKFCNHKHM